MSDSVELSMQYQRPANYSKPESSKELLKRYRKNERYFVDADLPKAEFAGENLDGVALVGANLRNANFWLTKLRNAHLNGANLVETKLKFTDMKGANLSNTKLQKADLIGAELEGANLQEAILNDANFRFARLGKASLLGAVGFHPDYTYIKDAEFSPIPFLSWRKPDYWTQLRQRYTGTSMLFTTIALIVFMIPLVAKTLFWVGVNESQEGLERHIGSIREKVIQLSDNAATELNPSNEALLQQLREKVSNKNWTRCLKSGCEDTHIIWLVLGLHRGLWLFIFTCILLVYNIGRGILTRAIGPLKEREERTGWTPAYDWKLKTLKCMHYCVWWIGWLAILAFAWHAIDWLSRSVSIPGVS